MTLLIAITNYLQYCMGLLTAITNHLQYCMALLIANIGHLQMCMKSNFRVGRWISEINKDIPSVTNHEKAFVVS